MELAQRLVLARPRPFALHHVDFDRRLHVGGRAVGAGLARGDAGVARDDHVKHVAQRLHTQRQRRDVHEDHVMPAALAGQRAGLQGRADRHDLVGVDALLGVLARQLAHQFLHRRNTRRAADQQHFVDLLFADLGLADRRLDRDRGLLDQVADQLFELCPRQRHLQMLRAFALD